jgi:hypothetical protein
MPAKIGLATGKEWIVEQGVAEAAGSMVGVNAFTRLETRAGPVYIFRAHVAYVEQVSQSVYERRDVVA